MIELLAENPALPIETSYLGQGVITMMLVWLMWRYEQKTESMKRTFEERAENIRRLFDEQQHRMIGAISEQAEEVHRLREAILMQPHFSPEQAASVLRGPSGPGPMNVKP